MAITYVKDIPDFDKKVKDVTNIDELELTVGQLSTSMLEVQGDITTLAGAMTTANEEIDNIWESNNCLGSKNILPYPYADGPSKTVSEVTFTSNSDGLITVNGTNTARNIGYFLVTKIPASTFKDGSYILSCEGIENCTSDTIYLRIQEYKSGTWVRNLTEVNKTNTSIVFEYSVDDTFDAISVVVQFGDIGSSATNVTLKPMIRPADYQDSTYVPYAMTNKELTDVVKCNQTTDGTYTLKATVSSSGVAYAWTADT